MSERGTLEKLFIKAYTTPDYSGRAVNEFESPVNPNEITIAVEIEYDSSQGSGTTNSRMNFKRVKKGDLTLTFFIDGTGVSGRAIDVMEKVTKFNSVTGYNGDIHRPNYLIIIWGTNEVKRCVLKTASIVYKMFRNDGVPMRALITAIFAQNSDDTSRIARAQDQSPDLTHLKLIKAGDTLPELCFQVYGDPGDYVDVARANKIDNFRNLVPGTRILFPPLEK